MTTTTELGNKSQLSAIVNVLTKVGFVLTDNVFTVENAKYDFSHPKNNQEISLTIIGERIYLTVSSN